MNEGKELFIEIIDAKLHYLDNLDKKALYFDDINLVVLYNKLLNSYDELASFSDALINYILSYDLKQRIKEEDIKHIRDLFIGKKQYHLNVKLSNKFANIVKNFLTIFKDMLDATNPDLVDVESEYYNCQKLYHKIMTSEVITEFSYIEKIVRDYNPQEFDINMLKIMQYINDHNIFILRVANQNSEEDIEISYTHRQTVNKRIREIIDKFNVNYRELPSYIITELRKANVEGITNLYDLIRRNKAEDYGILHLINRENYLFKIAILLYATPDSIRGVVDSLRLSNGAVDIPSLKMLLNNVGTCILEKENGYFHPKFKDYITNISLLKKLKVNYRSLIKKNPLFLISNSDIINYTLHYLEMYGANKVQIVNKCYKSLLLNPELLIDNIDVLRENGVDVGLYFEDIVQNYALLKCVHLNEKLPLIKKMSKDQDYIDYTKLLIGVIYQNAKLERPIWGDIND